MSQQANQINPPELPDLFDVYRRAAFSTFNAVQIGQIQSFSTDDQTAAVQILIKTVVSENTDGTRVLQERPVLLKVPCFVLTGGAAYLSMPIQAGDECIVLFNDREIDNWFSAGGSQAPTSARMHDVSDALALVGIRNLQRVISDYLAAAVRLSLSTSTRITLTEGQIASIATLFLHNGNMKVTGTLEVDGDVDMKANATVEGNLTVDGNMSVHGHMTGNGGTITIDDDLVAPGKTIEAGHLHADDGATGTFTNSVTVVNGIVTGGS